MAKKSKTLKQAPIGKKSLSAAIKSLRDTVSFYKGMGYLQTDVLPLNAALGGGIPRGRVIEIASKEGTGKTTLMLHAARTIVEKGHSVLYIDTERATTPSIIAGTGLSPYLDKKFHVVAESSYRGISDVFDMILQTDTAMIVIDSITAAKPAKLRDLNIEDVEPGLNARIQSTFFQKYKDMLAEKNIALVLLNQMRTKIRFVGASTLEPAGGNALKFYADARFILHRKEVLTRMVDGEKREYGSEVEILTTKNKVSGNSPPIPMTIVFGKGVSNISFITDGLTAMGHIKQSGAYFTLKAGRVEKRVQGYKALNALVDENYDFLVELVMEGTAVKSSVEIEADRLKQAFGGPEKAPPTDKQEGLEAEFTEQQKG